jgi:hypothetical protein
MRRSTRFEGRGIVIKAGSESGESHSIYRALAKHRVQHRR